MIYTEYTADLRKLVQTQLSNVTGGTYYSRAPKDASLPYKTFTLSRVDLNDLSRDDYDLQIDIWDVAADPRRVDSIGDAIEEQLHEQNLPQTTILPTFYRSNRYPVDDDDKSIIHSQLHFEVQLYTLPVPDPTPPPAEDQQQGG